jgi:hypothetical protein
MKRKKKFILGLILLLVAPTLVVLLLALYAYWDNARPQTEDLQTWVKSAVVLPWQDTAYFIKYNGKKPEPQPTSPPNLDVVFIVDVSSSMTGSLPAMAVAATDVLKEFVASRPGQINFALVRFDTAAQTTNDWTDDPQRLQSGLGNTAYVSDGGTDPRMAFQELDKLLSKARASAKKVVVWYTDGGFGGMSYDEIITKSKSLRSSGVEIFGVGPPVGGAASIVSEMTGDPRRVFNPTNAKDLTNSFRFLAEGIMFGVGEAGQISHRLDGRHFSAPLEGTNWNTDRSGTLNLSIGRLPETPVTYAHPLSPLSMGLWSVGVEPPRLVFTDKNEQLQKVSATHRPLLLVITWWTLLLLLLPAIAWALFHIPIRTRSVVEETPLPGIPRLHLPNRLPALPRIDEDRLPPIPTLFIGLGGAGRRALHAARADLRQAHLGHEGQPYRFLWIDLDTKEANRETPFDQWEQYAIEELVAPPEIRQVSIPEFGKTPENLKWFDVYKYQDVPRNELNLAEGSRGDRSLARLALFQWLAKKKDLLSTLESKCEELMAMNSEDGTRQIVVFASSGGGVGSGWALDIGRLLHRITRRRQAQGDEFVPETVCVISESRNSPHPENQKALQIEMETATLTGAFPHRVTYAEKEPLLDEVDTESPYNWIFKVDDFEDDSLASQCGELAATLIERHPRSSLLDQTSMLDSRRPILTITHGLHVLPTLVYDQVRYELFLRIVGPDILLDIEPDLTGGFAPKKVREEVAFTNLQEWVKDEPPGTPWQLLLAAAVDSSLAQGFLKTTQGSSAATKEWFANSISASLTRKLHGHSDAEKLSWHRDWMPGDTIATLRLLANRLEQNLKPQLKLQNDAPDAVRIVDYLITVSRSAADEIEKWLQNFCVICEKVSRQSADLARMQQKLDKLNRRSFINPESSRQQVESWARIGLEKWLGTPDTVSAICERLFLALVVEGSRTRVNVRSCIEGVKDFPTAEELASAIDRYSRALAYLVPAIRIEGALASIPEEGRVPLAKKLVDSQTRPRQVLVIAPRVSDQHDFSLRAIEEFKKLVPEPAHHGSRNDQGGDDHSALRRLELVESTDGAQLSTRTRLPLIQLAEQAAESLRQSAEKKHQVEVPQFPAQLRIALSNPEAFRSFARAYKAGHIIRQLDAAGAQQWMFMDTSEFLTFGGDQSLASAAANYIWYAKSHSQSFDKVGDGGSFAKLEAWLKERTPPDDDTLVQIAIDVYEN